METAARMQRTCSRNADFVKKIQFDLTEFLKWCTFEQKRRTIMTNNALISCCGSDCSVCYCYGKMCQGCNASCGKVFHCPEGEECAIYHCCVTKNGYKSCGECDKLPCDIILGTRDPKMTEEEFMKSVEERVNRLKGNK